MQEVANSERNHEVIYNITSEALEHGVETQNIIKYSREHHTFLNRVSTTQFVQVT